MGFISRKLLPACGNMCVCCPALNPSSRRPVKRYKKLLAEIFPKNIDDPPNERKIMKLCEYAAKNPLRIPKIAKYLEQRSYKELRSGHVNFVKIITEAYSKLLYICKEQMAYFSISLLNVIAQLVDSKQQDSFRILGCQALAKFIYSQADNTYARNIENLVHDVCVLARAFGKEEKRLLRASSLHCLSAMIWFMSEYSYIFGGLDEIIYGIMENYRTDEDVDNASRCESHHNWVAEVVRCETGGAAVTNDASPSNLGIRPRLETKDPAMLSREERESPEVWSRFCLHRLADLTNESTTLRRVLEPMLIYFDEGGHWPCCNGLALLVLSDLSISKKNSGNQHLILSAIIHHLDHKNIIYNPQIKSDVVQVATTFIRLHRPQTVITEVGVVTDLCRHLRKSLQATVESAGLQETNCNESLLNSIEDCLLEIIRGIADQHLIFDMMAITLEKLSMIAIVSRATIGSLLILAHIIYLTSLHSNPQIFSEALLVQLLKAMLHPDVETRTGAHQIFALILGRAPSHAREESEYLFETKKWQSKTTSVFASATALLEKLRREKEALNIDKHGASSLDQGKLRQTVDEEWRFCSIQKSIRHSSKLISSVIDRIAASTSVTDKDTSITYLTEDQVAQLLSGFWIQVIRTDNEPADYVAIANSFSLTLLCSRVKNSNQSSIVRTFQLLLSLRKASLDPNGLLPFSCRRSLFTFTTVLLEFAGRLYCIGGLPDLCKLITSSEIDPYLRVGEDLRISVRSHSDMSNYGSENDQLHAKSTLSNLRNIISENDQLLLDTLGLKLSTSTGLDKDDLAKQLTERFMPEDTSLFGLNPALDWVAPETPEDSASFDWEFSRRSSIDCDDVGHSPAAEIPRFSSVMPAQPISSNVISVGQLLESALHVAAGQVAGTSFSASPLPYGTMASQCEALGMGARKKLSSWLVSGHDTLPENPIPAENMKNQNFLQKADPCSFEQASLCTEPWFALRLPPASPFDNFMKAAGC